MKSVRESISELIGIHIPAETSTVEFEVLESVKEDGYTRQLITYASGGDQVPAYLLIPDEVKRNPAILINHQHNREHHLGKSAGRCYDGSTL